MKKKSSMQNNTIKNIVFAGGGTRCLWQVGFYNTIAPELKLKPEQVAAVSAGAAMASMIFSGNSDRGISYFKKISALNKKNFYVKNLFSKSPIFPHYNMYRDVILNTIDAAGLKKLKKGPALNILIARPPSRLGPGTATFFGLAAYSLEKKLKHPVHPVYASKMGFKPCVEPAIACASPDELADLILSSSCTPPFVPVMYWKGQVALDGGLVDNVPVCAIDNPGLTLVMLTRKYKRESIPSIPDRIYVQPSEPIGISKWDYTNPDGVQKAYDLGRRDAEEFIINRGAYLL